MSTKLSINVNKIATLRNTRPNLNIPDLVRLSRIALDAGAEGLTIHPRPDERHIRATDVDPLAALAREKNVEFNIEGNPFQGEYMNHCRRVRPTQCTLVPDDETQSTSDHGWDIEADGERLKPVIAELKALGCRVSLFIDADFPRGTGFQPVSSSGDHGLKTRATRIRALGTHRIELYTEPYASAFSRGKPDAAADFTAMARAAIEAGLELNAGHDLNLHNLAPFLAAVPGVREVSIGHALIGDALEFGLAETIRKYVAACG
jgi:pyridoxine 5-phosphate synthase